MGKSLFNRLSILLLSFTLTTVFPGSLQAKVFNVDTRADAVDANPGNGKCRTAAGKCSLRAAIMEANALPGADEVVLLDKVYIRTIAGDENAAAAGDLDILEDLTIKGAGRNKTFVDAAQLDRVFHVRPGVDKAVFEGLTIRNGQTSGYGAGIFNEGATLVLKGSAVASNTVRNDSVHAWGGGIANVDEGRVILRRSRVTGNLATGQTLGSGGGIYSQWGTVKIFSSSVSNNAVRGTAAAYGGGIYGFHSTLKVLDRSRVNSNLAVGDNGSNGYGGGIFGTNSSLTIRNSTVSQNILGGEVNSNGGGIYADGGQLKVIASRIKDNSMTGSGNGSGGGIYSESNTPFLLRDSTVSGNTASCTNDNTGGGIHSDNDELDISGSRISGNTAWGPADLASGGGLYCASQGEIRDSRFLGNLTGGRTGGYGGGMYIIPGVTVTLRGVTISGNSASGPAGYGGGIMATVASEVKVLDASSITRNTASENSGGIYIDITATVTVSPDSIIKKNIPNNTN